MARSRRSRPPRQRDVTPVDLPVDPALLAEPDPDATDGGGGTGGPSASAGGPDRAGTHGTDASDAPDEAVAALAEQPEAEAASMEAESAEAEVASMEAEAASVEAVQLEIDLFGSAPTGADPAEQELADAEAGDALVGSEAEARETQAAADGAEAEAELADAEANLRTAEAEAGLTEAHRAEQAQDVWDERVAGALAFLRRRLTGAYEVDEFGFDPELTDGVLHPMLHPLYRDWFRVEVTGAKHVPLDGAALVVANHSGTVALDALMLAHAVQNEPQLRRHLRLLGADLVFRLPFLSEIARKSGVTLACQPDAERLLRTGELVGVFPEGFKGVGKNYRDRYKLQRFGRGGFVSAALATGTPIVPVAIVGAEETYPMLGNVRPLARLLGLPYFPVTPTFPWLGPLGLVPLPSKWLIEFCAPIETEHLIDQADDPMVVFNLADQVRETIQQTLHELLARRPEPF